MCAQAGWLPCQLEALAPAALESNPLEHPPIVRSVPLNVPPTSELLPWNTLFQLS